MQRKASAIWQGGLKDGKGTISTDSGVLIHAGLIAGLANGTLRPVVGKEMPLAEAPRAHKEILEPGAAGKIVLIP